MGNLRIPNIEANVISVRDFFHLGSFDIPHYQRAYSWTELEVKILINDLHDAFKRDPNSTYLLGSITTIQELHISDRFEILDGQQRLTTLALIVKLIFDNLTKNEFELKAESKKILFKGNEDLRLTQGRVSDKSQFRLIMLNEGQRKDHRLPKNYDFIQQLSEDICQVEFIKFLLNSVVFVHVNTYTIENAYQIFETLNDRHRALQKIDLIRNRLFHNMQENQIEKACNYWDILYSKVNLIINGKSADTHLQSLFAIYLQATLGSWIETKDLFIEIKDLLEEHKSNPEYPYQLFLDIQSSFEIYVDIYRPGDSVGRVSSALSENTIHAIKEIKDLKISHAILFSLFTLLSKKTNPEPNDFLALENIIINLTHFIKRTKILGNIPVAKYGKEFSILAQTIINLESIEQLDSKWFLKHLKTIDLDNKSVIDNGVFIQKIISTDIKQDVAKTILIDIYNSQSKDTNEKRPIKINELCIDYICPQELTSTWQDSFNFQEHEYHLNKLGNYVLLNNKNDKSKVDKAQPFNNKKQIYKDSYFQTTQDLINKKTWQPKQIEIRTNELANEIANNLFIG
ncbi:MAG: DUF262 domain-containing HNH endonuclease family protein [Urechidicola sp.]|nr:DUF262 domain-containing HNH endonuclease family protein [Urechidicola sp.]